MTEGRWRLVLDGATFGWSSELLALGSQAAAHFTGDRNLIITAEEAKKKYDKAWNDLGSDSYIYKGVGVGLGVLAIEAVGLLGVGVRLTAGVISNVEKVVAPTAKLLGHLTPHLGIGGKVGLAVAGVSVVGAIVAAPEEAEQAGKINSTGYIAPEGYLQPANTNGPFHGFLDYLFRDSPFYRKGLVAGSKALQDAGETNIMYDPSKLKIDPRYNTRSLKSFTPGTNSENPAAQTPNNPPQTAPHPPQHFNIF